LVIAGAPRGEAGPSPGQVWPAVASSGRLWPGCGRPWCGRAWLWCGWTWLWCGRTWPGAADPAPFGAPLYGSFVDCYSHIYVPTSKNCNITRGTLLVSKMCMKLVVYSSRTRGFDDRIFVVRTVNKLPQAKCLLVLEQSLDLASVDHGLHDVITRQVTEHKLHALLAKLKRLVREKLGLTLPVGLLAFHLAFGS
jgi:hypothetical protein